MNLVLVPIAYYTTTTGRQQIMQVIVNLEEVPIKLSEGTVMGHLQDLKEVARSIQTPSTHESICEIEVSPEKQDFLHEIMHDESKEEKKFNTLPADIDTYRETKLKDAELSEQDREKFETLCIQYDDVFSKDSTDLGRSPLLTMEIDTGDHPLIRQRPYSLALKHVEWVQEEIEKLEQAGVITRSMPPWASPIVIVPKKTAHRRMCVNYRMVNSLAPPVVKAHSKAKGVLTFIPLPKIDEIFTKLKGSQIYSTFDIRSGYYHLELSKEAQAKTAFVIGGPIGEKWEFKVCPFGLTQAPAYFQRLVHQVLEGLTFAFGYLDDILIFSKNMEEHLRHVEILNLKLTARKCSFLKRHVQYLGHLISGNGIQPVPEKLKDLKEMVPPTTQKDVRRFLGFTNYYRKFIPRFADIARPLMNLTRKDVEFEWTPQCQQAFKLMKKMLLKEPILKYPNPNYGYILYTDASKYTWAGVLTQEYHYEQDGKTKIVHDPITYISGLFRGPQINWAASTKEAYAIYMSIKKIVSYITDNKVLLRSDHLPLKTFLLRNTKNDIVNNWAMELQQHTIEFEYIQGVKITLADTMSRLVKITPDIEKEPEKPDQEFGRFIFEKIDPILVETVTLEEDLSSPQKQDDKEKVDPIIGKQTIKWPITMDQLRLLQVKDDFCKKTIQRVMRSQKTDKQLAYPYYIKTGLLHKYITDGKQRFEAQVIPVNCANYLLKLAHDNLGHNGSTRTYMLL